MNKRRIFQVLTILLSLFSIYELIKSDLIPIKYLLGVIIGIILLIWISFFLLKKDKKVWKILGYLLLIVLILTNIFGIYHMNKMNHFIDKSFTGKKTETIKYYIVSLEENHLKKSDIEGEIGYYEQSTNVNAALEYVEKKYKVEKNNISDLNHLFEKLDQKELKTIIIEKTNFNIIMELDENRKEENYQILEEFSIEKKVKTSKNQREDCFNIYVGGTDYVGLMDFNTIITVNRNNHTILLTSIPRDFYVDVVGYNYKNKLSFITEGIDVSKDSVANLFGIDIDYYIKIDSDSVVKLVDEIGGIEYCSDYAYRGAYNIYVNGARRTVSYSIKEGCQHLNGYQTIAASRTRNAFNGRDRVRQQNMQKILVAILKKIASKEIITNYEGILNALSDSYETDIPKEIITSSVKDIINNGNRWTIEVQSVNGEDTHDTAHRFGFLTDWVMYPDMETVRIATEKINRNLETK